jgi:hypothetical protein
VIDLVELCAFVSLACASFCVGVFLVRAGIL